jgi:hypothetical protein
VGRSATTESTRATVLSSSTGRQARWLFFQHSDLGSELASANINSLNDRRVEFEIKTMLSGRLRAMRIELPSQTAAEDVTPLLCSDHLRDLGIEVCPKGLDPRAGLLSETMAGFFNIQTAIGNIGFSLRLRAASRTARAMSRPYLVEALMKKLRCTSKFDERIKKKTIPALQYIADKGNEDVMVEIARHLDDPFAKVRERAAKALWKMCKGADANALKSAYAALSSRLEDRSPRVRQAAQRALQRLSR